MPPNLMKIAGRTLARAHTPVYCPENEQAKSARVCPRPDPADDPQIDRVGAFTGLSVMLNASLS